MPLSWNEIKNRALVFSNAWKNSGYERGEAIPFWIDFFEIFGITNKRVGSFEHAVKKNGGGQGFIDLFWPGQMLVEHKSRGKPLDAAFDQAYDYFPGIKERDLPHTLVVCDFGVFRVKNLDTHEEHVFKLEELHKNIKLFGFIAGYKVQEIKPQDPVNIKAAERMGKLHDALLASGYEGHPLEVLLVRILFCLFADDTGIFQPAQAFRTFIEERTSADGSDAGPRLGQLFQALNTLESKRSKALDEQIAAFPYVNGKLFEEVLPMADFSGAMRDALLDACALDWSAISPAIFGSLFQSIMDKKARRNLGAHYTSEENILKVIKSLFLDDLRTEFERVKKIPGKRFEFHKKLRSLTFLDPACGCGNFLVISYRELRLLELDLLRVAYKTDQQQLDIHSLIACDVDQFYGIEIEEFPSQIAQVALWLMDHQLNLKVSEEFGAYYARIPLKATPKVINGNALQVDWTDVLKPESCSFILGNPPFLGKKEQSDAQKEDVKPIFAPVRGSGVLDFVSAWYIKAAKYMTSVGIEKAPLCAFVSTSSITQGEQIGVLWSWMAAQGIHINFAHRTFQWTNEAKGKAAVHCVIIGFALKNLPGKMLYEYADIKGDPHPLAAKHINAYLVDAPDLFLENRRNPIGEAPSVSYGSFALDDGHFTLDADARVAILAEDPASSKFIKPFIGGEELLNGIKRYCLWLKDATPQEVRNSSPIKKRVEAVRKWRASRDRETTKKLALTPSVFAEIRQPVGSYVAVPTVCSERREFLPMDFLQADVIASNQLYVIEGASIFEFGILMSTMHNAWVRAVCGRLESRFRYSAGIVYNNFPWPTVEQQEFDQKKLDKARVDIEHAATTLLDARSLFAGSSLADLYDPAAMPGSLRLAHQRLDKAVDKLYEFCGGKAKFISDAERVAYLFQLYERQTGLLAAAVPAKKVRARKIAVI